MSRKKSPITHGTVSGYLAERRRRVERCIECKAAWRGYYQSYRIKREELDAGTTS